MEGLPICMFVHRVYNACGGQKYTQDSLDL